MFFIEKRTVIFFIAIVDVLFLLFFLYALSGLFLIKKDRGITFNVPAGDEYKQLFLNKNQPYLAEINSNRFSLIKVENQKIEVLHIEHIQQLPTNTKPVAFQLKNLDDIIGSSKIRLLFKEENNSSFLLAITSGSSISLIRMDGKELVGNVKNLKELKYSELNLNTNKNSENSVYLIIISESNGGNYKYSVATLDLRND